MSEYTDHHDRSIDENLRAAAPGLDLPAPPSAERIAAWRTPAPMKMEGRENVAPRRPRFRYLAAGSALAATLAIGTALFMISAGNTVQAGTIIQNLRQKQIRGVNITVNKIAAEGYTIDGMIRIRSKSPIRVDQLAERDPFGPDEFGRLHANLTISGDASARPFPNSTWRGECAFSEDVGWVFVKMSEGMADAMNTGMPEWAMMTNLSRNGMVLNIGAITPEMLKMLTPPAPHEEALRDLTDEQIASINNASENFEKATGQPQNRLNSSTDSDGKRRVSVTLGMQANENGAGPIVKVEGAGQPANAAAMRMLNGTARRAELEQLTAFLKNANQNATVKDLGGGKYLLTADLTDPADPPAPGTTRRDATLTLAYEEQGGVQWAEITNLREASGSLRVDFVEDDIEPEALNYRRLVVQGQTGYIDLNMMMRMMGK